MKLELWLAFVATYTLICLIPGPSVLMVTGIALTKGRKEAFLCILGELLGGVVLIALSLLGVGAILAASAELFQIVKWAGVFYMAYLGCHQIYDASKLKSDPTLDTNTQANLASARAGFFTAILNPKAIFFYVAFLAQFLEPGGNIYSQFAIVTTTSTVIVAVILGFYATIASHARKRFQSARAQQKFGFMGGGFLLGGSVLMASTR